MAAVSAAAVAAAGMAALTVLVVVVAAVNIGGIAQIAAQQRVHRRVRLAAGAAIEPDARFCQRRRRFRRRSGHPRPAASENPPARRGRCRWYRRLPHGQFCRPPSHRTFCHISDPLPIHISKNPCSFSAASSFPFSLEPVSAKEGVSASKTALSGCLFAKIRAYTPPSLAPIKITFSIDSAFNSFAAKSTCSSASVV